VERTLILGALKKSNSVLLTAARFLGINRNTLHKKIKELKIPLR
jgi:DNA-binding NtrC family response regulator